MITTGTEPLVLYSNENSLLYSHIALTMHSASKLPSWLTEWSPCRSDLSACPSGATYGRPLLLLFFVVGVVDAHVNITPERLVTGLPNFAWAP